MDVTVPPSQPSRAARRTVGENGPEAPAGVQDGPCFLLLLLLLLHYR